MPIGFGFSVGDFIAAIELVGTVIDALRSSSSSGHDFRELISQLLSLEAALLQVKRLEFEDSQYAEVIALRQAAAHCQTTIDGFWKKIAKYQPSLVGEGRASNSKIKDGWMKIRWAICEKDDLATFKADLVGHTQSIQLLLATVQMGKTSLHEKKGGEREKSLAGKIQEGYFACMQRLSYAAQQGKQLLQITSRTLRMNVKIFQIVLQIQQFITKLPSQVEQQPVYFMDALGRASPFHLQFVRSAEALVAVLKLNFRKHGNGAEKIERGEFAIQDVAMKRDIDLGADWETCFVPGQRVNMSILFRKALVPGVTCPKCHAPNFEILSQDEEYNCSHCGLTYSQILDGDESKFELSKAYKVQDMNVESAETPFSQSSASNFEQREGVLGKRKREENDICAFQRVRIYDKPLGYTKERTQQRTINPFLGKEEPEIEAGPEELPRGMYCDLLPPETRRFQKSMFEQRPWMPPWRADLIVNVGNDGHMVDEPTVWEIK